MESLYITLRHADAPQRSLNEWDASKTLIRSIETSAGVARECVPSERVEKAGEGPLWRVTQQRLGCAPPFRPTRGMYKKRFAAPVGW